MLPPGLRALWRRRGSGRVSLLVGSSEGWSAWVSMCHVGVGNLEPVIGGEQFPINQTNTSTTPNKSHHITTHSPLVQIHHSSLTTKHPKTAPNIMGVVVPFLKAIMRAVYSPPPNHHTHLSNPPIPSMSKFIIYKLPRSPFVIMINYPTAFTHTHRPSTILPPHTSP